MSLNRRTITVPTPKSAPPLSGDEHKKLDRSFIKGVAWTGAAKWSIQLFTWAMTLVVARLLTPDDYGIVAMAGVYLGLLELMTQFGIGSSIVMLSGLSENQIAQINALSILLGLAGFLISCIAAVPLGWFFDTPALAKVIPVMGIGFIINSLQTVPSALLQKEHRFKVISVIGTIRGVAQSTAVVVLAWLGFRYWSLILGTLLGSAVGAGFILLARRHGLAKPRFSSLTHPLRFSWQVLVASISFYAYSNADFVIAGRLLGQAALGNYNLAWTLANTPLEKVTTLIGSVTPAFYAAVKEDPSALRRYLLRPIEAIALVIFPAMLGLSLVAKDTVLALLGAKWEAAIPVLQLLALYASVRSIMPLFPQVLMAVGDAGFVMWNGILSMFVLPMAFFFGSHWGIVGIAAAWVVAYPVNAIPLYWRVHRKIGLTHREFFRALLPAINGSVVMSLGVLASKSLLNGHFWPTIQPIIQACPWESPYLPKITLMLQWLLDGRFGHLVRLIVQIVCGGTAYILTVWIFHRERLLAFRHGIAKIRQ